MNAKQDAKTFQNAPQGRPENINWLSSILKPGTVYANTMIGKGIISLFQRQQTNVLWKVNVDMKNMDTNAL